MVFRYGRFLDVLRSFPHKLIMGWPDGHLPGVVLLVSVVSLLLLATTRVSSDVPQGSTPDKRWFPEICFALALLCYLCLPAVLIQPVWIWELNVRFAVVVALFGVVLIRGSIQGWRRALLLPAILACLAYSVSITERFEAFNSRARGFFTMLDQVPRGATVLTLMLGSNVEPTLDPETIPFSEFYSYPIVFKGGYDPYGWDFGFPFERIASNALPAPPWHSPHLFDQARDGIHYDFVMTHNEQRDKQIFGKIGARVPLVAKDGSWRIYATRNIR